MRYVQMMVVCDDCGAEQASRSDVTERYTDPPDCGCCPGTFIGLTLDEPTMPEGWKRTTYDKRILCPNCLETWS